MVCRVWCRMSVDTIFTVRTFLIFNSKIYDTELRLVLIQGIVALSVFKQDTPRSKNLCFISTMSTGRGPSPFVSSFCQICSYQGPFVKLLIFVTESGWKSTNYRHLVRCGEKIYKSTVKLKEMSLPHKLKVSPVFCDHQNTNLLYFSVNNSDWHLRSVYVTSP